MRPEDFRIGAAGEEGLAVTVHLVEELGADGYIYSHGEVAGRRVDLVARVNGGLYPRLGEMVTLVPASGRVHVFDAETGERLSGPVGRGPVGSVPAAAAVS